MFFCLKRSFRVLSANQMATVVVHSLQNFGLGFPPHTHTHTFCWPFNKKFLITFFLFLVILMLVNPHTHRTKQITLNACIPVKFVSLVRFPVKSDTEETLSIFSSQKKFEILFSDNFCFTVTIKLVSRITFMNNKCKQINYPIEYNSCDPRLFFLN